MLQEMIGKLIIGDRDGTTLWKIAIGEIEYAPITEPAEGVSVATLAENMLRCGQLQPILLCRIREKSDSTAKYRLITGRRRLEAMRMLGKTHISAIVVACEDEQIPLIALSDNLLHREPNYLAAAKQISSLIASNWTLGKLAPLLSESEDSLSKLIALLDLPSDEQRLLKLCQISRADAVRLNELPDPQRRAVLEGCLADPSCDPKKLMDDLTRDPEPHAMQPQKVWVSDVRVFLNSVRRAAETMQKAGHDTEVEEDEQEGFYQFQIRVAKKAGAKLPRKSTNVSRETSRDLPKNVSRETAKTAKNDRFASILSIFEAIAEDERTLGTIEADEQNVSRETCADQVFGTQENGEKLEICIDEPLKK